MKNVKSLLVKNLLPQILHEQCQISFSEEFYSQIVCEECQISHSEEISSSKFA
jgi:hypothetical protein